MRLQLPAPLSSCIAAWLLLLTGCAEPPAQEESPCAAVTCTSGSCGVDARGAAVCQPTAKNLDEHPSGSSHLEAAGDKDVYTFHATAGVFYRFSCTQTQRWNVELFAPSGAKVATGQEGYTFNIEVQHQAREAGLYTLTVTHPGGDAASYDYQLTVSDLDDHGFGLGDATRIALGDTTAGRLDAPRDGDSFVWASEDRRIYRVTVSGWLRNASIAVVDAATNRQLGGGGAPLPGSTEDRTFFVVAPATGNVLLSVYGLDTVFGAGDYTVRVEALGLDDHSGHDDLATELQVPTVPTEGALDYPGDVDVLRFSATAGRLYRLRCTPGTLAGPCHLDLRNADWTLREETSADNELLYEVPQDAVYILRLSGGGLGSYTYSLEDVGTASREGSLRPGCPRRI